MGVIPPKSPARPYQPGPAQYAPPSLPVLCPPWLLLLLVGLVAFGGYYMLAQAVRSNLAQPAGSERVMAVEVPLHGSITFWLAQTTAGQVTVKDVSIQLSNPGFKPATPLQRQVPVPPMRSSLKGRD